jgi:hypothetical protein
VQGTESNRYKSTESSKKNYKMSIISSSFLVLYP